MNAQKIVVGFDDSPMSAAALRWAAEQSRLSGAELLAVHTWELPSAGKYGTGWERPDTGCGTHEDAESWIAAALGERPGRLSIQVEVLAGSAGPVLVELAEGAALLVVGTREHTGMRRLVSGSVSHYCLSHATCPVVAVPGPVTERVHRKVHIEAAVPIGPLF